MERPATGIVMVQRCCHLLLLAMCVLGCRSMHQAAPSLAETRISLSDAPSLLPATLSAQEAPDHPTDIAQASFDDAQEISPVAEPENDRSLSLSSAIATALAQNPDLIAQRQNIPAARAALGVANTYPFNPYFQAEVLPYSREANGDNASVVNVLQLVQTFELAHQRRFRSAAGVAVVNRTEWAVMNSQLQTISQTERLYFTALYRRELRNLARSIADIDASFLPLMQRRFDAGQANAADVATAKLNRRTSQLQAGLAETNLQTALIDLKRQIGLPAQYPLDLPTDFTTWRWQPASNSSSTDADSENTTAEDIALVNAALDNTADESLLADADIAQLALSRPDVMTARADAEAAAAALSLARAARVPNLQLGPLYDRDDAGTVMAGIKTQMDIPIVNSGAPLVRQRLAEFGQRQTAAEQLEIKAMLEARAAVLRYERARKLTSEVSRSFADEMPEELGQVENLFEAGQVDVLRVFAVRAGILQSRRAFLDSLNELAQSAAEMTAATGLPADRMIDSP